MLGCFLSEKSADKVAGVDLVVSEKQFQKVPSRLLSTVAPPLVSLARRTQAGSHLFPFSREL